MRIMIAAALALCATVTTASAGNPPKTLRAADPVECLAVALYHEARGESAQGQRAVASVILQRAIQTGSKQAVCKVLKPGAFSFVSSGGHFPAIREQGAWSRSMSLAAEMIKRGPLPELRQADHYHATHVKPGWSSRMPRVARIGSHVFYRGK